MVLMTRLTVENGDLRLRHPERGLCDGIARRVFDIADDPHDRALLAKDVGKLPDGRFVREVQTDERLVHDQHSRRIRPIPFVEEPAASKRDPQRLEVTGRRGMIPTRAVGVAAADDREPAVLVVPGPGQVGAGAGGGHAGQPSNVVEQRSEKAPSRRWIAVTHRWQRHGCGQHS